MIPRSIGIFCFLDQEGVLGPILPQNYWKEKVGCFNEFDIIVVLISERYWNRSQEWGIGLNVGQQREVFS